MRSETERLCAAIDIGTNSMHLIIAKRHEDVDQIDVLSTERQSVRLGAAMTQDRRLQPDAIDRGIEALVQFCEIARGYGVEPVAVATSAVRSATNKDEFLHRARDEADVEVQLVSGVEEARLIFQGASQAIDLFDTTSLVFDIGGGSTELIVGQHGQAKAIRSLLLGCIRISDAFFAHGETSQQSVLDARNYVRNFLQPVRSSFSGFQIETVVGCSGTIGAIVEVVLNQRGESYAQMNGACVSASELREVCESIFTKSQQQRIEELGLSERRADIILGGAAIAVELIDVFGVQELLFSSGALREGLIADRLALASTNDLRLNNALNLAAALDNDPDHAERVSSIAVNLFDELQEIHGLGSEARELLGLAAIVHNVGVSISHTAHHKHSHYVIRNSDVLTGFTIRETELLAAIARYHRRALPSIDHPEFKSLDESDRYLVSVSAGLLRVAIGLDRRHSGVVEKVTCDEQDGHITVQVHGQGCDIEVYSASERSGLLADSLGKSVSVTAASAS